MKRIARKSKEQLLLVSPRSEAESFTLLFGGFFCFCALIFAVNSETAVTRGLAVLIFAFLLAGTAFFFFRAVKTTIAIDKIAGTIKIVNIGRQRKEVRFEQLGDLKRVVCVRSGDPGNGRLRFEFNEAHDQSRLRSIAEIEISNEEYRGVQAWLGNS